MPSASPATIVITGATSGVGEASARLLASLGARVVIVARDPARAQAVASDLPGPRAAPVIADLSTVAGVRSAADALQTAYPRIDVLVNNAGGVFMRRETTADGHERTIALNVLAPYLLTRLLEPALRRAASPRVVNIASAAHRGAHLDLDDLDSVRRYRGFSVYGRSKLALILITRAFARRSNPSDLAFFSVHPGFVRSRFGHNNGGAFGLGMRLAMVLGGISPERAAKTVAFAATSPTLSGRSGEYISRERIARASAESRVDGDGERLWTVLAGWSGLPP
jgi:NAD(P)-dependent dehydrogenase (short-subunit alcohol dehydrogenase family)